MRPVLQSVAAASTSGTIPRVHERALRILPRAAYLCGCGADGACSHCGLGGTNSATAGARSGDGTVQPACVSEASAAPPHIDVLILQKLRLAPGLKFLEIGCGAGYLTALAAYLVGSNGSATGVDISQEAVAAAQRLSAAAFESPRLAGAAAARPQFLYRDGGLLLELGETFQAVCVSGHISAAWIKTLRKLLAPKGRLVACVDGKLRLYEQMTASQNGNSSASSTLTSTVIGAACFPAMSLARRARRSDSLHAQAAPKRAPAATPASSGVVARVGSKGNASGVEPAAPLAAGAGGAASGTAAAAAAAAQAAGAAPKRSGGGGGKAGANANAAADEGLSLRMAGRGLIAAPADNGNAKAKSSDDDAAMAAVMKEVEREEMSGLLLTEADIEICRTADGRKCRLGEGGFGVVFKALMNGVDEVAVKLVKVWCPSGVLLFLCPPGHQYCCGACIRCCVHAAFRQHC